MDHPLAGLTGMVRVELTVAIQDWMVMHNDLVQRFRARKRQSPPGPGADAANRARKDLDPQSDAGRTFLFDTLCSSRGIKFEEWVNEEMLLFIAVALPTELLRRATKAGKQPLFLTHVFKAWRPRLVDWLWLLWDLSGHACEFYADMLFVMPDEQRAPKSDMMRLLFRWMPEYGVFSEWTCVSIAQALIPHASHPSCARIHADYINEAINLLPPYNIGLIVRSLLLGQGQPFFTCRCGYQMEETYCKCIHPDGLVNSNRPPVPGEAPSNALQLDSARVFATILLKLLVTHIEGIPSFHPTHCPWTNEMRDEMIRSACEHVFTQAGYIVVHRSVTSQTNAKPPPLQNPRPYQNVGGDMEDYRNMEADFENSVAQTGSCIIANCKQIAKDGCMNLACKTHCGSLMLECRVHRYYPHSREYKPRRNVEKKLVIGNKRSSDIPRELD